jgi:hypothetical protein
MNTLLLCLMLVAQTSAIQPSGDAKAEQVEGVYVFIQSKPTQATEYLGTVKGGNTGFNTPSGMVTRLVREAKKKYPATQAIIVVPDLDKADAVKFK